MANLLTLSLSLAVPLWIEKMKKVPIAELRAEAAEIGQTIAEKGDVAQFKSKKKGETANSFNAVARGLAILAFSPGGVKFFNLHFEAKHPDEA